MSDNLKKGSFLVVIPLVSGLMALVITHIMARYYTAQFQATQDAFYAQADTLQKIMRRDAKLYTRPE